MMGNSDLNAKPPFQVLVCRVFKGALASRLQALLVLGRRIESSMASFAATSERNSSIGKLSGMWFFAQSLCNGGSHWDFGGFLGISHTAFLQTKASNSNNDGLASRFIDAKPLWAALYQSLNPITTEDYEHR